MVALGDRWLMCAMFLYQWPVHPPLPTGEKLQDFSGLNVTVLMLCISGITASLFQNNKRSCDLLKTA